MNRYVLGANCIYAKCQLKDYHRKSLLTDFAKNKICGLQKNIEKVITEKFVVLRLGTT